jgi:hypothetical protein
MSKLRYMDIDLTKLSKKYLGMAILFTDKFSDEFCVLVGYDNKFIYIKTRSSGEELMVRPDNYKIVYMVT